METIEQLLKTGHTREARARAQQVLEARPDDAEALLAMAKLKLLSSELPAAEALLARLEQKGETVDTVIARGNLAIQRNDAVQARTRFARAVTMQPVRAEAFFGLGVVQAADREYPKAAQSFARAVELAPEQGVFHYHLAQAQLAIGEAAAAVPHATRAVELSPAFPSGYQLLARLLVIAGKPKKAHALLKEGLRVLPDNPLLLSELTNTDVVAGNLGAAFFAAASLVKKQPQDPIAVANLALLLLAQHRNLEVLELCQKMESKRLSTATLKCIEATVHESQQPANLPAAIRCYEQAMALDAADWSSANNLGQLLLRKGEPSQLARAVTVLEEAVHRRPGQLEPMLNLALAYARTRQPKKSRALAKKLLSYGLPATDPMRGQAERLLKAVA